MTVHDHSPRSSADPSRNWQAADDTYGYEDDRYQPSHRTQQDPSYADASRGSSQDSYQQGSYQQDSRQQDSYQYDDRTAQYGTGGYPQTSAGSHTGSYASYAGSAAGSHTGSFTRPDVTSAAPAAPSASAQTGYQQAAYPETDYRPAYEQPAASPQWRTTHAEAAPPTWTPPPTDNGGTGGPGGSEPAKPSGDADGKRMNPKVAVAGALVAVALASGGITAGIMAATGSGSSSTSTANGPGGMGQTGGGPNGTTGTTSTTLHGTAVVSDGNGTYTTQLTQTGTVSAVSSSSITVKSADGYSKTYVIGSSTQVDNGADKISSVVKGHTVRIVATSADSKVTATSITDTNLASTTTQNGNGTGTGTQQQNGQQNGGSAPNGQAPGN